MLVAVVGCGHGEIDKIYEVVAGIEEKRRVKVSIVLCCGDFQSVRNMTDLRCMACPIKYQLMHDFHKYYSGEKVAPIPTVFVGGNHEASNYLQELPYGGWVAHNIYYLGSNVIRFGSLRIAGVSGIFKGADYLKGRFECPPYDHSTMRSVYHYRNLDIFRLKQMKSHIDILLSHDWPLNIHTYGDTLALLRRKPFFREEIENGTLGSPPLESLLHHVQPSYWFCAHMHVKFSAVVPHQTEGDQNSSADSAQKPKPKVTKFLALDKILPKRHFLQLIEIPEEENEGTEKKLCYDAEWLAILKSTNSLQTGKQNISYMPGPNSIGERFDFTPTDEEIEEVCSLVGNLEIPLNFSRTAPPFEEGERPQPAYPIENPQTTTFCNLLGVSDPLRLVPGYSIALGGSSYSRHEHRHEATPTWPDDDHDQNLRPPASFESTAFTRTAFNPDEISLDDDDEDGNIENSEVEAKRPKLNLPPPKNDDENIESGPRNPGEQAALLTLFNSTDEPSTQNEPLFFLDTTGEQK